MAPKVRVIHGTIRYPVCRPRRGRTSEVPPIIPLMRPKQAMTSPVVTIMDQINNIKNFNQKFHQANKPINYPTNHFSDTTTNRK